jgi:hypothetical protein
MNDQIHKRVKKKVKAKKGFLIHLGIYMCVGLFFFLMNLATFSQADGWWFFFPMIPWMVGIGAHYLAVFGFPGQKNLVEKWEAEELAKELYKYREESDRPTLPPAPDDQELPDLPRQLKKLKERETRELYDDRDLV